MRRVLLTTAAVMAAALAAACSGPAGDAASTDVAGASATTAGAAVDPVEAEAFVRERLSFWVQPAGAAPVEASTSAAASTRSRPLPRRTEAQMDRANDAENAATYTPTLAGLIARDRDTTPEGEMGALSYNPLCGCQDATTVSMGEVAMTPGPGGRQQAAVSVVDGGAGSTQTLRFLVERTPVGLRIADVFTSEPGDRGMLALLTEFLAARPAAAG